MSGSIIYTYVEGNPLSYTDPSGLFVVALPFIPPIVEGIIGAGIGIGGAAGLCSMLSICSGAADEPKSAPPRGLPPEGIDPPTEGQCKPGPASRPSERDKGGQSLWDPKGGEWRYFPENKWHNPHWDYQPKPGSPWQNIPIGGLPPVK